MQVAPHVTTITLGRWSPRRLNATYPPTPGAPSTLAYLVLLRVEIARFPPAPVVQLALRRGPKLVSVALILTLCRPLRAQFSVDSR